jgi:hypothetical protein
MGTAELRHGDAAALFFMNFKHLFDIVKGSMKNRYGICRRTRETLPLEGGGKRVGVEGTDSHSKRA